LDDKPRAAPPTTAADETDQARRLTVVLRWLGRNAITAAVLAALVGLAYWGHQNDWKLPKFSALINDDDDDADEKEKDKNRCADHNVVKALCIECNPELIPPSPEYGWCAKHGIADCPLDHPDLAQVQGSPQMPRYDVEAALKLGDRHSNTPKCQLHRRRIQFASEEAVNKAGIDIAVAQEHPMVEAVSAAGEITYDAT